MSSVAFEELGCTLSASYRSLTGVMAAITGLKLTQTVIRVLETPMSTVTFYSDSLDAHWWIRGHGKDFREFVANRVGEIQMFSGPQQWQHASTEQNQADLVSRVVNVEDLKEKASWGNGPDWLLKDENNWPRVSDDNLASSRSEKSKKTYSLG